MSQQPVPVDPGPEEDLAWLDRDPVTAEEREAWLDRVCEHDDPLPLVRHPRRRVRQAAFGGWIVTRFR